MLTLVFNQFNQIIFFQFLTKLFNFSISNSCESRIICVTKIHVRRFNKLNQTSTERCSKRLNNWKQARVIYANFVVESLYQWSNTEHRGDVIRKDAGRGRPSIRHISMLLYRMSYFLQWNPFEMVDRGNGSDTLI